MAMEALPAYFRPDTHIEGINAPDLHTLNSVLGATIEDQTVTSLNAMRPIWDPDKNHSLYSFVRQPQTFPDVLLRRAPGASAEPEIIMGIELKGWYVVAHEGEPNFRFTVTPNVCAPADLIAVVPWALSQVLSGRPRAFIPYVAPARWAAKSRNHHWENERDTTLDSSIISPPGAASARPYPRKADKIDDKPAADGGGNFGRLARCGIIHCHEGGRLCFDSLALAVLHAIEVSRS